MSKGEEKIVSLLQKSKISFEREKSFKDLRRGLYRFDFCLTRNGKLILLEFQGEQHYQYVPKFYHSRSDFLKAKERDRKKIAYALAHNTPLYIIPYWEIDNLHTAADLFQSRFLAQTMWKNDMDWQQYRNLTKNSKVDIIKKKKTKR